jgi:hypothetical protein
MSFEDTLPKLKSNTYYHIRINSNIMIDSGKELTNLMPDLIRQLANMTSSNTLYIRVSDVNYNPEGHFLHNLRMNLN